MKERKNGKLSFFKTEWSQILTDFDKEQENGEAEASKSYIWISLAVLCPLKFVKTIQGWSKIKVISWTHLGQVFKENCVSLRKVGQKCRVSQCVQNALKHPVKCLVSYLLSLPKNRSVSYSLCSFSRVEFDICELYKVRIILPRLEDSCDDIVFKSF